MCQSPLGKSYVWGAKGPDTFDCSGLTAYCHDRQIPDGSYNQFPAGAPGDGSPGDLVFFGAPGERISHVGICVGGGKMIHAPQPGQVVSYAYYKPSEHYEARFRGFRRFWTSRGNTNPTPDTPSDDKNILDTYFYKNKYSDLSSMTNAQLLDHWNTFGKKEGRMPCVYYDPPYYLDKNPDIKKALGTNWLSVYNHFIQNGISEFRNSSPVYDGSYYHKHTDLAKMDGWSLIQHFVTFGMKEGRQASDNFDVMDYINSHKQLTSSYGNDYPKYYYHYLFNN